MRLPAPILSVTEPLEPPPVNPSPAVTALMSPVSDIANTPSVADSPEPAIAVTKSAIDSFLLELSPASIIGKLSFATSIVAAVNSLRSSANETAPLEPPPDSPLPPVTALISPVSDIANTPSVASSPEPAIALTKSAILSFLLPFEALASIIAMLSALTSTTAAVNSLRSNAKLPEPHNDIAPPPDNPSPAVTLNELLVSL